MSHLSHPLRAFLAAALAAPPVDCVSLCARWLDACGVDAPWAEIEAQRALSPSARVRAVRVWLDRRLERRGAPEAMAGDLVAARAAGPVRDVAFGLIGPTRRVIIAGRAGLVSAALARVRILAIWAGPEIGGCDA